MRNTSVIIRIKYQMSEGESVLFKIKKCHLHRRKQTVKLSVLSRKHAYTHISQKPPFSVQNKARKPLIFRYNYEYFHLKICKPKRVVVRHYNNILSHQQIPSEPHVIFSLDRDVFGNI